MRPILEYCSPVWDAFPIKKYTNNIEKVQHRTARFMFNRSYNMSYPTDMVRQLQWESLEQRRRKARLTMFYKNSTLASSCLFTSHCDMGTEGEACIPPPLPNKLLLDGLIQKKRGGFPRNKAVEYTPTIHCF